MCLITAINELYDMLRPDTPPARGSQGSESHVDSLIMLEAADKDVTLFRNNVGACQDKNRSSYPLWSGQRVERDERTYQVTRPRGVAFRLLLRPIWWVIQLHNLRCEKLKAASWDGSHFITT